MAEPFAITTETFENEVLKSDVPVVDFWASGARPAAR